MTTLDSTNFSRQRPATIVLLSPSVIIISFFLITKNCNATCYFSAEFRGSYKTQGAITENQIQYSQINITEDSIPIWGICHKRIGNNVILMSSEQPICYRCFNLKLLSRNILRACTTDPDYISKCNANEEKALASCPTDDILQDSTRYTEIILYKQIDGDGQEIRKEYCPINGRYKIKYNNDDGQENTVECSTLDSELDNCPSSSSLNLRFKKCTFEDHEIAFVCLGHWEGNNKQMYLALMKAHSGKDKLGPQFRCAIYKENPQNGVISIVFSKDSTCSFTNKQTSENKVESPHSEVLTLYPNELNYWPHEHFCQFPEWMQGHWEDLFVKNDTIMFRDQTSLKSYTMKCLQNISDHILVYSRTQCDEGAYQCLRIKNRSPNILEFQISSTISLNFSHSICSNDHFDNTRWLTQGRLDHNYVYSPCPVIGKFKGTIPDDTNLCAKLVSECSTGDVMNYEIFECQFGEVYEERKYRCLGQWEEDNLIYTYTKRLDVGTYECFVGAERSESQVYIKEAGEHCQRNVDPNRYGMELNKIENCQTIPHVIHPTQRNQKSETFPQIPLSSTQKSITEISESTYNTQKSTTHRPKASGSNSIVNYHSNLMILLLVALKLSKYFVSI